MQESYSVTQDLSYSEYIGLAFYMLPKNKMIRRLVIFIFCISMLSAVSGLLAPAPGKGVSVGSLLIQIAGPVLVILLFFVVCILLLGAVVFIFKPDAIKGVTFTFTHWGMERVAAKSTSSIPWKDFQDVKETKSFILLFVKEKNINNSYAIKKASCKDTEYENELAGFIEKNRPL